MLSSSAFNAFLKTLEEPPSYAIFILATTEKHKILPTILSRCQIFDFKRITTNDTVEHLQDICDKEEITAEKAALQVIAQKSEGCMRDALSIMDKIVSFTNGELNYTNTLEHLNILDADYYFRLLDCMLNQDLAGAMLLYDDINRKGFEGDLVLNGLAEFIRNLLVCKDAKAASLLEVVESFRDRYIETAGKVSAAVLISSLNILNEAEINYKAARNKRLHVELVLIKLCYLQQALELSSDAGGLSKKKLVESARPVAFRKITPLEWKEQPTKTGVQPLAVKNAEEKLIIETPRIDRTGIKPKVADEKPATQPKATGVPTGSKLSALEKIRKQYQENGKNNNQVSNTPLQMETLQQSWAGYVQKLKEARNPAAQPFEMAELKINDENSFEVITANNIEQKFIEQERNELFSFLQQGLKNRLLQFNVVVSENPGDRPIIEAPLTSKEQFRRMAEQYPLLAELRNRLRMDLD
jgi:DNA polymerase-3 subunit gamma/tau